MKFRERLKKYLMSIERSRHPNLRLWLLLAIIPLSVVGFIYFYGNLNLDSSIIIENDMDTDKATLQEEYEINERKVNYAIHANKKTVLPQTKQTVTKTTSKTDKRMLDEDGNMLTIEVKDESTTLETIAKSLFGNEVFWIYILEVNQDKLSGPSDIKIGMKLYIPNAEYYGFSAKDAASVQYAKHKSEELLNKEKNHE